MPAPEFGFCPQCEKRRELVMNEVGFLQCHACNSMDIYDSRQEYEDEMERRKQDD